MIEYAFPYERSNGMTLRDYFAAMALPCVINEKLNQECDTFDIVEQAYSYADAMMVARDFDLTL